MLSLYQVIGDLAKEGGGGGQKEPLRVFRISFHNLCTFSSWELVNRPLNDIHLRLGGRRGGEGVCFVPQYYKPTHFAEPHP